MALRYVLLIVIGSGLIASGVFLVYPPAGIITAGCELIAAGYVGLYFAAREAEE